MSTARLSRLLHLLAEALDAGDLVNVRLDASGRSARLTIGGQAGAEVAPAVPVASAGVRPFSPTEQAFLAVCTRDWQTAPAIAAALGQKCGSAMYTLLANLAERGALESGRAGYRLPEGRTS